MDIDSSDKEPNKKLNTVYPSKTIRVGNIRLKSDLDSTDSEILKLLSEDGIMSAPKIAMMLEKKKISMTARGIRKRIKSMQKNKTITKFSIILDDEASGKKIKRIILVKFQHTKNFLDRLEEYKKYLENAPHCTFAVRVRGDLDWIHYKCFPTKEIADLEDDVFRQTFGDIILNYNSYDADIMKNNFDGIIDANGIQNHLSKYLNNNK